MPEAWLAALGWFCAAALLFSPSVVAADPEWTFRVRATWGGGDARMWRGTLVIRDGKLGDPRSLTTVAHVPDEMVLEPQRLQFVQPVAMSTNGLECEVTGRPDSKLTLELVPLDEPEGARRLEFKLAELVPGSRDASSVDLDERRNTASLERAPDDRLRVRFERPALVFSPREEFALHLTPFQLGVAAHASLRCQLQLQPVQTNSVVWREQHDLRADADGGLAELGPIRVPMPDNEGVYDLVITVTSRRFAETLVPEGLVPGGLKPPSLVPTKPVAQRRIQLVVLEEKPPAVVEPREWSWVEEVDSNNPKWWDKISWLPHWKVLPGRAPRAPLGEPPLQPWESAGLRGNELAAGGWHAAPLPIRELGQPHWVEVEYPSAVRQALGIAVVEPEAGGKVELANPDSGILAMGSGLPGNQEWHRQRLVFWPRTRHPWLVLSNRRDDGPAVFGKIRVLAGPEALPPLVVESLPDGKPATENRAERLLVACYDRPSFAQNFGAARGLDPVSGQPLADWQTFYLGATRLLEYLRHAGYNGLMVPVICEGGALYPSRVLATSARYEEGRRFHSGQDPVGKDVLEMLLRLCDRAGVRLIPMIEYATWIPKLDAELRASQTDLEGIAMVGFLAGDPQPRLGRADARLGAAPFYNPLDPRVQAAMREVAGEVLERCRHHRSFGGLAVRLSPHGYAAIPDDTWCLDDATYARFARDSKRNNPTGMDRLELRRQEIRGPAREEWLKWRAAELTRLYRGLADDIESVQADAQLVLNTRELLSGRVVQAALRPQLLAHGDWNEALLRHGLDLTQLSVEARAVVPRPRALPAALRVAEASTLWDLSQSEEVDTPFRRASQRAALATGETSVWRLTAWDRSSPFGPDQSALAISAPWMPVGPQRRQALVQALAQLDATWFAEGGPSLPFGQEERLRSLAQTWRRLPVVSFQDVPPEKGAGSSPLVVRTATDQGTTYVYCANPTGLATQVRVALNRPPGTTAESLDDRPPPTWPATGGPTEWNVALEPYDVAAIAIATPEVTVNSWRVRVGGDAQAELTGLVQQLRLRVDQLDRFQPAPELPNADFEQPTVRGEIPGWRFSRAPGVLVEPDANGPFRGRHSLHLKVTEGKSLGWVMSQPFSLPRTGRISVQSWIRTRDGEQQPPLRMSIDGQLASGQPYYRWSSLGIDVDSRTWLPSGRKAIPVPTQWAAAPFLLPLTDLPANTTGEIAVRFDLLGPGEVWIDEVQVSDIYFEPKERHELLKNVATANLKLQQGDLPACHQYLHSFWPRYILENVPPPRVAQAVLPSAPAATPPAPESPQDPSAPTKDRDKGLKWPFLNKGRFKVGGK